MEPFWLGNANTMHLSEPPILHSHCLEVASTGCHLAPPPGSSEYFDSRQLDHVVTHSLLYHTSEPRLVQVLR